MYLFAIIVGILIFGVVLSFGILLVGSRGPILWIAVFVLWELVKKLDMAMRMILSVLAGIVMLFFDLCYGLTVYSRVMDCIVGHCICW